MHDVTLTYTRIFIEDLEFVPLFGLKCVTKKLEAEYWPPLKKNLLFSKLLFPKIFIQIYGKVTDFMKKKRPGITFLKGSTQFSREIGKMVVSSCQYIF